MPAFEANYDGLVGPTHNYAGLSYGNVASLSHKLETSNPREAALQGLAKMKALSDLGLKQGVLAPQERPDAAALRRIGFAGDDAQVLAKALKAAPEILASAASASSMWTANAATVCPSADSEDNRVHFTAANLVSKFHRSLEGETTSRILRATFPDAKRFAHHDPLPSNSAFGDEGAANHTRFCRSYGEQGLQFFVYGRSAFDVSSAEPRRYPARQTLEASQAVARLNRVREDLCAFGQQNPYAIDAGAFHNDVVAVGDRDLLFHHELAFHDSERALEELRIKFASICGVELRFLRVDEARVSLADAIKSYLFNSQLVALPDGSTCLVAPEECRETDSVRDFLDETVAGAASPIRKVRFFDLRQSMRNGGGPACLRLRVAMNDAELAAVNRGALMNDVLHARLVRWVESRYRDRLAIADLADPELLRESREALDELTQILGLGSVYPFQLP